MARKTALLLSVLLLFTGCSGNGAMLFSSMDNLLQAPTLNQQQAEVYEALQSTMSVADVVYKYPQTGEYRSPFVFYDLDGDGMDEAIVFYAHASYVDEVRAKIMRRDETGKWYSFFDVAGQGDQVDFVQFSDLLTQESPCLLIGWKSTGKREATMGVYAIKNGRVSQEIWHPYTAYAVISYMGNAPSQLVLVTQDSRDNPYEVVLFGSQGNHMMIQDSIILDPDTANVLQMLRGRLWTGDYGVYIDEVLDNDTIATEVIRIHPQGALELIAGGMFGQQSEEWDYYVETFRPDRVLSVDLNGDEEIAIPRLTYLPGTEEGDEITPLMLTEYRHLTRDGLQAAYRAVVNESAGYLVFFPERWLDRVTVVSYPETNEWRFYQVDADTGSPSLELLRILAQSSQEYQWQSISDYILLETRGNYQYYAYVPELEEEPLGLTEAEARRLFALR